MRNLFVIPAIVALSLALLALAPDNGNGKGKGPRSFHAVLSGDEEVPPVVTDTSGRFRIQFDQDFRSAEIRLDVRDGVRVTQAHLHCGIAGMNGPVIIFLGGFHDRGWDIDGRWLDNVTITADNIVNTSCGTTLEEVADAIREGGVYVNVHTVAHGSGEIRGQLGED